MSSDTGSRRGGSIRYESPIKEEQEEEESTDWRSRPITIKRGHDGDWDRGGDSRSTRIKTESDSSAILTSSHTPPDTSTAPIKHEYMNESAKVSSTQELLPPFSLYNIRLGGFGFEDWSGNKIEYSFQIPLLLLLQLMMIMAPSPPPRLRPEALITEAASAMDELLHRAVSPLPPR